MLQLCICDDRKEDIASIKTLVDWFSGRYPEHPIQASYFHTPYDLLESLEETGGYDLYLLDIIMPHISGIDLAQKIRKRGERAKILFLTTSREYGIEAIGVKASGYLLKPIQQQAFSDAVLSCIKELALENNPSFVVKTRLGLTRVQISELVMIESFDHTRELTLSNGDKMETTARLSDLFELLRDMSCIIFPHRAYIVNMDYIRGISNNGILMTNGRQLPVSRKSYPKVKSAYLEYMMRTQI